MIECKFCDVSCKNIVGLMRHNRLAHNIGTDEFRKTYTELYPKKEITEDMIQCKVCLEYVLPLGMPNHLKKHNLSTKEYYDQYCKSEEEGKCKICGKPTSFAGISKGYRKFCSSKCANLDPETQQKLKSTYMSKYGVEHPLKSKEVKDKVKQTNLDRYGVESALQLESTREKALESLRSESTIKKRQETCIERYGATSPFGSTDIQQKVKETNLSKYGADNIFASDYGKQKLKETNLARYGVENGGASKQAQQKIKETRNKKSMQFCKDNNCIPLTDLEVDYSVKDSIFHSKLLLFNDRYYVKTEYIDEIINHTPQSNGQSVIENTIASFVASIYKGQIIRNTRSIIKPKELDIYIPDKNLAIEVDGIWYHSANNFTPKDYHLSKTLACENLGIRLIHITDWEWENRQDICKSIISSALGIYETKIYARQCDVREVSQNDCDNFLNVNHIQGKIKATYRLGLYYKNELVQLICLGKSRFKKNEIELLRMCTKLNTQVVGGFSKLIEHQPYDEFISYVDRSKFDGHGYAKLGFEFVTTTGPSYKYYKDGVELNRIAAQKHKLPNLLGADFDSNETESQNMIRCGWLQVFDCGTIKLYYTKKTATY